MVELSKCFIIMPISTPDNWLQKYSNDKDHFQHVLNHLLIPSIIKAGLDPISPITKGSEIIQGDIISNIESADLVLCDMSILNPNVFFEFGIRTALNKPVCTIIDDVIENIPFDTAIINSHTYLSALNPWTLDKEILDLSIHIKESLNRSKGSNSLWKYFSIKSTAQPINTEPNVENRIDLLTRQIEALREQLSSKNKEGFHIQRNELPIIIDIISNIISPVSILSWIANGKSLDIRLSEKIDDVKFEEMVKEIVDRGYHINKILWDEI